MQEELALSGSAQHRLSEENARLASELSSAKTEVESLRVEHREFCSRAIGAQGPLLQAFLYKLTRSSAFGEFVNGCGDAINPLATTDSIDLVSLDHPDHDIKKPEYGYDKDVREQVNWRLAEKILKAADFPLLNSLKGADHLLSAEEILGSAVDEDLMFRELARRRLLAHWVLQWCQEENRLRFCQQELPKPLKSQSSHPCRTCRILRM